MNKFDKALEFVVLGGFLALTFVLMRVTVPEANAQHFGQALGALTVIATLVAKSLWERGSATALVDEQKAANTGKAFEAITATANAGHSSQALKDEQGEA